MMRGPSRDTTIDEIERAYRSAFKAFVRTAMAYLGDAEAAHDAVQDGVATAIRRRGTHRGEGTVEAWLWTVVLNTIRSRYRERVRSRVIAGHVDEAEAVGDREPDAAVRAAVAGLPERQRLVLFLRFYADMDYQAIAETLGMSPGTVGAALHAARATLKNELEEVRT